MGWDEKGGGWKGGGEVGFAGLGLRGDEYRIGRDMGYYESVAKMVSKKLVSRVDTCAPAGPACPIRWTGKAKTRLRFKRFT